MSMNAKDMDHRETMLTTARLIAACYGTPPQLVNIPGESTYSNYEQATLAYWSDTVLPFVSLQLEELDRWLLPLFGEKDMFFDYDQEQIPALEPRRKELFKRINDAEFLTINEKREATGYAKHNKPNADDILVSDNDIPLEKLGEIDPKIHPELAPDVKPEPDPQPKP
jgi:phage portal protein BeeE